MSAGVYAVLWLVIVWPLISYGTSVLTGWHSLANRFRFEGGTFQGAKWRFQTGYMRFFSHYGSSLTVGVDPAGLYLSVWPILRIGHPPLLIPWSEVSVMPASQSRLNPTVELKLGRENPIPLQLRVRLVGKLRQAAGAAWPAESVTV